MTRSIVRGDFIICRASRVIKHWATARSKMVVAIAVLRADVALHVPAAGAGHTVAPVGLHKADVTCAVSRQIPLAVGIQGCLGLPPIGFGPGSRHEIISKAK